MKKLNLITITTLFISLPAMSGLFDDILPVSSAVMPAVEPFQANEYFAEGIPQLEENPYEWMLSVEQPLPDGDAETGALLEDTLEDEFAAAAPIFRSSTITQGAHAKRKITAAEKKERRKLKNRDSAKKSRLKKQELIRSLRAQNKELTEENDHLKNTLKDSLEELKQLKSRLGDL